MPTNWLPLTLDELSSALRDGVLVESHLVDFKREIAAGQGANRDLAKDLAAFSVDGGTLFIGVDEDRLPVFTRWLWAGSKSEWIRWRGRRSCLQYTSAACNRPQAAPGNL